MFNTLDAPRLTYGNIV